MKLEELMLKKEELPILDEVCFEVPIHPKLLAPDVQISYDLAKTVFPQAVSEWYTDLQAHRKTAELDDSIKGWLDSVFLQREPKIKMEFGHQEILNGLWRDEIANLQNGFAYGLSISRDFGGSLYFNRGEMGCRTSVPMDNNGSLYLKFSSEKARAFHFKEMDLDEFRAAMIYTYTQHNVDNFPGALFLRNWGMLYINAAIREVAKSQANQICG